MSARKKIGSIGLMTGMLLLAAAGAKADDAGENLPAICTDRPTKSNYACTVEPGHFQYEADLFNATAYDKGGSSTETWLVLNPTLKYGIAPGIDIEGSFSPFVRVRNDDGRGAASVITGPSDVTVRLKYQFADADESKLQATLLPYVKAPTARLGIGNGAWEGGLLLPVNYKLTDTITLTTVPELDVLKNSLDDGRHAATSQLVNMGLALAGGITLYAELWGAWNFDPVGTVEQFSADAAVAYALTPYFQIDAGLNFGLNAATPDMQGYVGISQKF
ncbi:MAG: transporter [Alphaproteobacteria bacterium]|nr:transporter [Alphaproteobacteria bacterium]